jgi:hypothetical protein
MSNFQRHLMAGTSLLALMSLSASANAQNVSFTNATTSHDWFDSNIWCRIGRKFEGVL